MLEQPQVPVWPVAGELPIAEDHFAVDVVAIEVGVLQSGPDLGRQLVAHTLVAVQEEDPLKLEADVTQSPGLLLGPWGLKVERYDTRPGRLGDFTGSVSRSGIDDYDFSGPAHACEGVWQVRLLVEDGQHDGQGQLFRGFQVRAAPAAFDRTIDPYIRSNASPT